MTGVHAFLYLTALQRDVSIAVAASIVLLEASETMFDS
jgi:hypothetical protein